VVVVEWLSLVVVELLRVLDPSDEAALEVLLETDLELVPEPELPVEKVDPMSPHLMFEKVT
jgi:hypothetical protein